MKLAAARIVTRDVEALARFYQRVTGVTPVGSDEYVELRTAGARLAISSENAVRLFGAAPAESATNRSLILDFEVEDVDIERARIDGVVVDWVLEPTTQPWGNRSMLFRDPDGNLGFLADLSSMDSVRALASDVRMQCDPLDVLVNNAATVSRRRETTVDGIEKTLATNHLASFLLTNLLVDRLRSAPAGRIINVASESHASAIVWDNLESVRGYNFFRAYLLSKTCNLRAALVASTTAVRWHCVLPSARPRNERMRSGEALAGNARVLVPSPTYSRSSRCRGA